MAGRPKRRARLEAGLPPPPPNHTPVEKPPPRKLVMHVPKIPVHEWRAMDVNKRVSVLLGMSDDDAFRLMSIPWEEADLHEKGLKIRVWEVLTKLNARWGLELHRDEERDRILERMRRELEERKDH